MKELGEKLLNKRLESGVSLEEAAEDINYNAKQLEAIEKGEFKIFKDIFVLKCMITDYAKYLGFDPDEIIDEFNDYVFESTSKIPLADIEKASKLKEKQEDAKIMSPYTMVEPKKNKLIMGLIIGIIVLVVAAIAIFIYNATVSSDDDSNLKVSYVEK